MATAQTVLNQILETFPDVDDDPTALAYLNRAHEWICTQVQLKDSTESFTSLVAGTAEYPLTATVTKIWSGRYVKSASAGDFTPIRPTSIEELDYVDENWRAHGNGTPAQFYIHGTDIGFYRKPDTATSGSYPQIVLEVTAKETLVVGTTMPAQTTNYDAWVWRVNAELALVKEDERFSHFMAMAERSMDELYVLVNKLAKLPPETSPKTLSRPFRRK